MYAAVLSLSALALGPATTTIEAPHRRNDVYRMLVEQGLTIEGRRVAFPAPLLSDGESVEAQRQALRTIAGSDRAVAEFLRDSVSAPFVLKTHDEPATDRGTVRGAALWFAVHADLDAVKLDSEVKRIGLEKPVEAGNMSVSGRILSAVDLESRGIARSERPDAPRVWYVHLSGRLLDRIAVESTDRVVATRSAASWVIAAKTDPRFDADATFPNRWSPLLHKGGQEHAGPAQHYEGGASYAKISRLSADPGTLVIESHFAFFEPRAWFNGAPILRSKFSLIAQDQIRRLRRELLATKQAPRP